MASTSIRHLANVGGKVTNPVRGNPGLCGLSASRALWCNDHQTGWWRKYGGNFKNIKGGNIVLGRDHNDRVSVLRDGELQDMGGQVTQVAASFSLVAVAPSGAAWITGPYRPVNWKRLE